MGNKFEVYAYLQLYEGLSNNYSFVRKYSGESLFKALFIAAKLKIKGVHFVKVEWR